MAIISLQRNNFLVMISVMTPENNCWGARTVKVPTVSGVQESLQTMPEVLPKKTIKKVTDFMKCRRYMEI